MQLIIALHIMLLSVICCVDSTRRHRNNNMTGELSHEARLLNELLSRTDTAGQRMARPVHDVNDRLPVHYGLSLIQILDVDEINQNIVINVWESFLWSDEFHSWDPSEYGGVERVNLLPDMVWTPDIVLYQNIEKQRTGQNNHKLILSSNGEIFWITSCIYKSTCAIVAKNFPFDVQQCNFKFGPWSYRSSEVEVEFYHDDHAISLEEYLPNLEWTVLNSSGEHHAQNYSCCQNTTFSDLTFSLVIQRHWRFYFMSLLMPAIVLSCMSLMIFLIPPGRPDRTSLGTSVISSFMLLLILVTSGSPPSEDIYFAKYISVNMVMLGLSTLFSCIMVNLAIRTTPMPAVTKQILLGPLATMCGVTSSHTGTARNRKAMNVHVNNAGDSEERHHHNHQADWQSGVKVLDRLMLVLYLIVLLVCFLLYFPRP